MRLDLQDGSVDVIDRREVFYWSISPDGGRIAYEAYREPAPSGECGFDLYTASVDGRSTGSCTRSAHRAPAVTGRGSGS